MTNEHICLLTIYTEAALESQLIKDIERLGAPGYTITNARGKGSHGVRQASWEANANIRVEIIGNFDIAKTISKYLQETYYDNFAMVTFISQIDVLRPEKFTSK